MNTRFGISYGCSLLHFILLSAWEIHVSMSVGVGVMIGIFWSWLADLVEFVKFVLSVLVQFWDSSSWSCVESELRFVLISSFVLSWRLILGSFSHGHGIGVTSNTAVLFEISFWATHFFTAVCWSLQTCIDPSFLSVCHWNFWFKMFIDFFL
jgi:hypothetical protein